MSGANYNGRQPNNTAYIKNFVEGTIPPIWTIDNISSTTDTIIVPVNPLKSVYIPGNLYISGQIINVPITKTNSNIHYITEPITTEQSNILLNIETLKITNNITKEVSFDINNTLSDLSSNDLIYLLVKKIQDLQEQVTNLENRLNNL